jgi:hypothetical protein
VVERDLPAERRLEARGAETAARLTQGAVLREDGVVCLGEVDGWLEVLYVCAGSQGVMVLSFD